MSDEEVLAQITKLADEERELHLARGGGSLSADDVERLERLEVTLDQCWDLLRQRRALRNAGLDPDAAKVRPESVVEHYRQ